MNLSLVPFFAFEVVVHLPVPLHAAEEQVEHSVLQQIQQQMNMVMDHQGGSTCIYDADRCSVSVGAAPKST